ncbi:hypothetical protein ACGFYQ_08310 [Streptomyces sp. NPDC048258]
MVVCGDDGLARRPASDVWNLGGALTGKEAAFATSFVESAISRATSG